MRTHTIILSGLMLAASLDTVSENSVYAANPPYIIPVTSDGSFNVDSDGKYVDMVQMSESGVDGVYTIKNINIDYGFVFYGKYNSQDAMYSLAYNAADPILWGDFLNPLGVTAPGSGYIKVDKGTYDISFYDRDLVGRSYHIFSIRNAAEPDEVIYPSKIYIQTSDNKYIELPGEDGIYKDEITLPESFRITYQQFPGIDAFYYGPASPDATLIRNKEALGLKPDNSGAFSYQSVPEGEVSLSAGDLAYVTVNLHPGDESVLVSKNLLTSVNDLSVSDCKVYPIEGGIVVENSGDTPMEIYDISGILRYSGADKELTGLAPGLYLIRIGQSSYKIVVR